MINHCYSSDYRLQLNAWKQTDRRKRAPVAVGCTILRKYSATSLGIKQHPEKSALSGRDMDMRMYLLNTGRNSWTVVCRPLLAAS
jgi:hypothetical protein